MTEHEFDQKVEAAAQRFERRVEHAASKLDNGLTGAWNCSRVFRTASRAASFAAGAGLLLAAAIWPGRGAAQRPPAVLRWGRPGCRQSLPLLFSFAENSGRAGGHPRTASADGPAPADGMRRAEDSLPKAANTARQPAAHSKACPICRIRMRRPRRTQCKAFYLAVFNGKKEGFPCEKPSFFCIILSILYK